MTVETSSRFELGPRCSEQVKYEVIEKKFTGCERREMPNGFRFKVMHVAWPEPQRKRRMSDARSLPRKVLLLRYSL